MRIGIIVAMDKELSLLLPMIEGHTLEQSQGCYFHTGTIGRHQVVAMECGIGKVNAAISTIELIGRYQPDLVVSTGVAGAADARANVMDLVVADRIAYHDVWCGPGTQYGEAAGAALYFKSDEKVLGLIPGSDSVKHGLLCSGDKFIASLEEVEQIKKHFPDALAVDMESAAIAHVCARRGVPMACMRVISDSPGAGHDNSREYDDFWAEAPEYTFEVVRQLLDKIE